MAFEFRPYVPLQPRPQRLKKQEHAVSLPQNHIQVTNAAEDLDGMWPFERAGETAKEIIDETLGSADELPPIEELWKVKRPNGITSAKSSVPSTLTSLDDRTGPNSHAQADGDTEISGKNHDYAIIINEDTNLDQTIDMAFLAPTNSGPDASVNIVRKDPHDNSSPAAEELLHVQVESDPAPVYHETTDFSIDSSIGALCLAPATQTSAEMADLENRDAEERKDSASTSASAEGPPTPPVVDEMSEDEWEAVEIIGEELINGKLHYTVEWKPTAVPEEDCGNMRELVEEWKKSKTRRRKSGKRTGSRTPQLAQEAGVSKKATKSQGEGKKSNNKDSTKRRRGRPRKV